MGEQRAVAVAEEPGYLAQFDSASAMVRALVASLERRPFRNLDADRVNGPVMRLVTQLPKALSERIYRWGGWLEGVDASKVADVSELEISRWLAAAYPRRRYPAIAVGSSNGAAVMLCAALGIPWLPQTVLMQLRRSADADDLREDMEWGAKVAPALLDRNPNLELHHMADPNQDRLMLPRTAYFRLKRRRLGEPERGFIADVLEPGGTIFVVDCHKRWPLVKVAERHWYQVGGWGGIPPQEYLDGSERVKRFIAAHGGHGANWSVDAPTEEGPEAEWGFAEPLLDDVERLAGEGGYRVRRIRFPDAEDLSPVVADVYRWWYERLGYPTDRLFAPCFFLLEPHWTMRTASVPFWTSFAVEQAAAALEHHLDTRPAFAEAYATLFCHGVESIGIASVERWRAVLAKAKRRSDLVGVDAERFPRDFSVFVRYHDALRGLPGHHPLPGPLTLEEFDRALDAVGTGDVSVT